MARPESCQKLRSFRKGCRFCLAFCWIAGLLSGVAVYASAAGSLVALMRGMQGCSVSIVGLLWGNVLPVLVCVAFSSAPAVIYLVCFWKAFSFAFLSLGILHCFGSAGWLCRLLFFFSDLAVIPAMYLYWQRVLSGRRGAPVWLIGWVLLLSWADHRVIAPFAAGLIIF